MISFLPLAYQEPAVLPTKPVAVALNEANGAKIAVPVKGAKATVIIFVSTDCPIANRFAPEISRIGRDYKSKDVTLILAYPGKGQKAAEVLAHTKDFGLEAHAALDPQLKLLKACGASVTPHAVIVGPTGQVMYLGRVNDLFEEHGKTKEKVTRADLRIALDEFLAGKPITEPVTQAVGCWISG